MIYKKIEECHYAGKTDCIIEYDNKIIDELKLREFIISEPFNISGISYCLISWKNNNINKKYYKKIKTQLEYIYFRIKIAKFFNKRYIIFRRKLLIKVIYELLVNGFDIEQKIGNNYYVINL